MVFTSLTPGDAGPVVHDLHRRLAQLGFIAPAHPDDFDDLTAAAVASFQRSRGLEPDGICGEATWKALHEAEHQFGDRALYLTSPMLRGDDVSSLQLLLGTLGFDTGRIDGIFGANTQRALREFQRNVGLVVDGVCARDTISQLQRVPTRGTGLSVAGLREREALRGRSTELAGMRIALCHTGAHPTLLGSIGADLQRSQALVAVYSSDDWSQLAAETNDYGADVCIAIETVDHLCVDLAYFGTTGNESSAGRTLAEALLRQLPHTPGWGPGVAHPMRLPILRETRCPTIRLKVGPLAELDELHSLIAAATQRSLRAWAVKPG